jgi:predicted ATPase/chorismate mutase
VVLKIEVQTEPVQLGLKKLEEDAAALRAQLKAPDGTGLEVDRAAVVKEIAEVKALMGESAKKYQAALTAIKEWDTRRNAIIGTAESAGTITELKRRIADLDAVPAQLTDALQKRSECCRGIFQEIARLKGLYAELYRPVQEFIAAHPLVQNKLQLRFQVRMVDSGFSDGFFEYVAQNVRGSFRGNGPKVVQDLLEHTNLDSEVEVMRFVARVGELLHTDAGAKEPATLAVSTQVKAKKKNPAEVVLELYDYIFSLGYLRPQFTLMAGDMDISMLSPGERGTLLLVFYLLVDKSKCPLIIDQPEENLDNKTVAELLVPCLWEAKKNRQVIIVTHNPNLAVVADAEQIIIATHKKKEGNEVRYHAGAIENQEINGALLDILEGTEPAFNNRRRKYLVYRK